MAENELADVLDAHVKRLMDLGRYMLTHNADTADYATVGRLIAEAVNDYPDLRRRASALRADERKGQS